MLNLETLLKLEKIINNLSPVIIYTATKLPAVVFASVGVPDVGVSGLGVSGLGVSGLGVSGLGVLGLGVLGLGVSGLGVSGLGVSVLGASVERTQNKSELANSLSNTTSLCFSVIVKSTVGSVVCVCLIRVKKRERERVVGNEE